MGEPVKPSATSAERVASEPFFCSDKDRFGSSDCEKQCPACAAKPVAWLHNKHPNAYVITARVKELWLACNPDHVENYTVPVYPSDYRELSAVRHALDCIVSRHVEDEFIPSEYWDMAKEALKGSSAPSSERLTVDDPTVKALAELRRMLTLGTIPLGATITLLSAEGALTEAREIAQRQINDAEQARLELAAVRVELHRNRDGLERALSAAPAEGVATVLEMLAKARAHVCQIAAGTDRWRMSIPAQPDYDSDLVIVAAIDAAEKALSARSASAEMVMVPLSELEELSLMASISTADRQSTNWSPAFQAIADKVELLIPAPDSKPEQL